jgi:hypothetical protein
MQISVARSTDLEFGVIDPVKGTKFFPVKTALASTAAADQFDAANELPIAFVRLQGDEYLILGVGPEPNGVEANLTNSTLYRFRITLPADLTQEAPDSIKVELLGKEDLGAMKLGQSPTGALGGLAVGRNNATGKPVLYMTDWALNLFTLQPK